MRLFARKKQPYQRRLGPNTNFPFVFGFTYIKRGIYKCPQLLKPNNHFVMAFVTVKGEAVVCTATIVTLLAPRTSFSAFQR
jgi:hypothetical protein